MPALGSCKFIWYNPKSLSCQAIEAIVRHRLSAMPALQACFNILIWGLARWLNWYLRDCADAGIENNSNTVINFNLLFIIAT